MSTGQATRFTSILALALVLSACGGGGDDSVLDPGAGATPGGTGPEGGSGPGVSPGTANVALRSFSYTDAGLWRYRMELQTAADATADAAGNLMRYERYTSNVEGTLTNWSFWTDSSGQDDLYFNGTSWRKCLPGYRTTVTGLSTNGERRFNYCDSYATGTESIVPTDISGQTMASVIQAIRTESGDDGFVAYANYGPDPALLGSATFPANAYRQDVLATVDAFSPRYAPTDANKVRAWLPDIAAGGDRRAGSTRNCVTIPNTAQPDDVSPVATTLEQMIASAPGTPCILANTNTNNQPVTPDEFWNATTQEFGVLQGVDVRPANSADFYFPEPSLRVAFTSPGVVTFYECLVRRSPAPPSVRNCRPPGSTFGVVTTPAPAAATGTYTIETLGDARVMRFAGMPARFDGLGRDRVFVERGGIVYAGTIERAGIRDEIGFNDVATRALLGALNIPVPVPVD